MALNADAHWRDSARPVKFFMWDGRVAFPVVIFLMHISWWTFAITFISIIFLSILNRYGLSPIVFLRAFRSFIAGKRKIAVPWWMT